MFIVAVRLFYLLRLLMVDGAAVSGLKFVRFFRPWKPQIHTNRHEFRKSRSITGCGSGASPFAFLFALTWRFRQEIAITSPPYLEELFMKISLATSYWYPMVYKIFDTKRGRKGVALTCRIWRSIFVSCWKSINEIFQVEEGLSRRAYDSCSVPRLGFSQVRHSLRIKQSRGWLRGYDKQNISVRQTRR